jgi:hypothetical protein
MSRTLLAKLPSSDVVHILGYCIIVMLSLAVFVVLFGLHMVVAIAITKGSYWGALRLRSTKNLKTHSDLQGCSQKTVRGTKMIPSLSFLSTGTSINSTHYGGRKCNFRLRGGTHVTRSESQEDF